MFLVSKHKLRGGGGVNTSIYSNIYLLTLGTADSFYVAHLRWIPLTLMHIMNI